MDPRSGRSLSFGGWASEYDRYRPQYAHGFIADLVSASHEIAGQEPARVIDLGAGTGQVSRRLADAGLDVIAVEPDERMGAVLAQRIEASRIQRAPAENLPLPDGAADLVVAAQMWHWVDHDRAAAELARVLRPGGMTVLAWNYRDDTVDWVAERNRRAGFRDAYRRFTHGDPPCLGARFRDPVVRSYPNPRLIGRDDLVGLVGTFSAVRMGDRSPSAVDPLTATRRLLREHPDLVGRADISVPYITKSYWFRRNPD